MLVFSICSMLFCFLISSQRAIFFFSMAYLSQLSIGRQDQLIIMLRRVRCNNLDYQYRMFEEQTYRIELLCHRPPHECRTVRNQSTNISSEDLTQNLIKFNPGLLKYLGKYQQTKTKSEGVIETNDKIQKSEPQKEKEALPYKSIVQEKGLRYIITDPLSQNLQNQKPIQTIASPKNTTSGLKEDIGTVMTPRKYEKNGKSKPKQQIPKRIQGKTERQVKQFYKDLKQTSRYLSDTGFRKYFDRQVFQNYGHKNVTHQADGFVYHNYLKTHNINPHTGNNLPNTEETFYHALVTASPEKYQLTRAVVEKSQKHAGRVSKVTEFQKDELDPKKLIKDNLRQTKIEEKYDNLRLKPHQNQNSIKQSHEPLKQSQKLLENTQIAQSRKNVEQQLNVNQQSLLNVNQQSKRTVSFQMENNQLPSNLNLPQTKNLKKISAFSSDNPAETRIDHEMSKNCKCCLDNMKQAILEVAEKDPQLAQRLITSARKQTMYKNYSLNNFENAAKNPHNYRNCSGKLNVGID